VKEETGFEDDVLILVYQRNFTHLNPRHVYLVYKYVHMYPKYRQAYTIFGISPTSFHRLFYETTEDMANCIDELDYSIRLAPFNHCIHFPTRVTDTIVVHISNPVQYCLAKALYNPKYAGFELKWQVVVDLLGNYLLLTGPHVVYDGHIYLL